MTTAKTRKNDLQVLMESVQKLEIELRELREQYLYHVHTIPGGRPGSRGHVDIDVRI